MTNVMKTLTLPGGREVVLFDSLANSEATLVERARNVIMLDSQGQTVWRVSSNFDASGDPFTNVIFEGAVLQGYRWDGGMYEIDLATGIATPSQLSR